MHVSDFDKKNNSNNNKSLQNFTQTKFKLLFDLSKNSKHSENIKMLYFFE